MGQRANQRVIVILILLGLLGFGAAAGIGCGAGPAGGGAADPLDPGFPPDDDPVDSDGDDLVDSVIDDDTPFTNARALSVGAGDTQVRDGEITSLTQVDVFNIGRVQAGERLIISVAPDDDLDPVLGLFDSAGDSMMINDDRNYYGGDLSSRINMQARHDSASCYVAVAASHQSGGRGAYVLTVTRSAVEDLREPVPQTVYLNFDGASEIVIGRRDPVTIPVFEESELADHFGSQSEELIAALVDEVRQDYDGLNVAVLSSREEDRPDGPHTTIHFGAFDPGLLGIADYVDEFNAALTQKAIVYADTFRAFLPLGPTVEEMARALANVASHETGHLLGLNHTTDPLDIMDTSASLRQMLADQTFRRSRLIRDVFPIGHQDNARLLVEAVGGDLSKVRANARNTRALRVRWYDEGDPTPARLDQPFSTCFCETCAKHRRG